MLLAQSLRRADQRLRSISPVATGVVVDELLHTAAVLAERIPITPEGIVRLT